MSVTPSLTQSAGRGALFQLMGGSFTTIIRLGASVFLARALTPTDFGLIGMAMLLREFVFMMGSANMGAGVIVKGDLNEKDLCTFFWCMAPLRVLMFLIAFLGAPLAVFIFDDSRVVDVLRAISFTFLMSILALTAQPILARKLKFFQINLCVILTALMESALAVVLVLNTDFGYWAIVVAMLFQALVQNMIYLFLAGWFPKFLFSKSSFRYLFKFGINNFGFTITNYLRQNLDYLLVGKMLGTASLGLYEFAYRIPHLVQDRISRPVGVVILPALAKVKHDNEALSQGYRNAVMYIGLISFPLLFGLAALADVAVPVMWGDQWLSIIFPLQLLSLCAALRIAVQPLGAIFACKERPDLPFKISIITLFWTVIVVGVLAYYYGINGVAFGMVLSVLPEYFLAWIAFRIIDSNITLLFKTLRPVLLSSSACGLSAYALSQFLQFINVPLGSVLALGILIGVLFYWVCLLFICPNVIKEALILLKEVVGHKHKIGALNGKRA